jgi:hypothetical protein
MISSPAMIAASSYDPLQLAVLQSAALDQRPLSTPPSALAADTLKLLTWIELGEETMLRAEDDCLVEYDPQHHALLHQLYGSWLSLCRRLLAAADDAAVTFSAEDMEQLRSGDERVAQWLQVQSDIQRHTLSESELHTLASRANLSAGARGVSPPADA